MLLKANANNLEHRFFLVFRRIHSIVVFFFLAFHIVALWFTRVPGFAAVQDCRKVFSPIGILRVLICQDYWRYRLPLPIASPAFGGKIPALHMHRMIFSVG